MEDLESKFSESLSDVEKSLKNIKQTNKHINKELKKQDITIEELKTKTNDTHTNVKSMTNKTNHSTKWYKGCIIQ